MKKGGYRCTDWDFYLKDVYIHFNSPTGKDITLSRCLLKLKTKHFITDNEHNSMGLKKKKSKNKKRNGNEDENENENENENNSKKRR